MVLLYILLPLGGLFCGVVARWLYAKNHLTSVEQQAIRLQSEAVKQAEVKKKELLLENKEQLVRERQQQERDFREQRTELQKFERRLLNKEEQYERQQTELEKKKKKNLQYEERLAGREKAVQREERNWQSKLEEIAGLSAEEAKNMILARLENEAKHDAQVIVEKIEQEARMTADRKARTLLVESVQRLASEVTSEVTVASVSLPNDEMKGRIIGREGRNIRTLELVTGADIIIDDTPEAAIVSCFDPVRKEVAKISLQRLIVDGRIHPARIEEIVGKVNHEIEQIIYEEGEKLLFDLGINNMNPEFIPLLGRLYFRNSYGQNMLAHSREVTNIAALLAAEVGADVNIAKRGALLHDIGKGAPIDGDNSHAETGAEIARRLGEDARVQNAILAHHNDVEPSCIESVVVQVADIISASRPGARRETINSYIKRLENLENIANQFEGVEKSYAIQAGRELRIIVNNDKISDKLTKNLARDIARKIEEELRYPGRIKVTIIRELRIIEYAR